MTTWDEALHPRVGGKFAKKGTGSAAKGSGEGLSYNGRTGAGYGKKGGDNRVSALQKQLNKLGLTDSQGNALKVDGKLGPRTTAAIKKAQRALGLKADGVATPGLLAKLREAKDLKSLRQAGMAKKKVPVKGTGKKKGAPVKKAAPPKARKVAPKKAAPVTVHVR